tara:strand:+ start:269 stop:1210 length:942 start_codon:yes stop_codon:yes gene_type:complete
MTGQRSLEDLTSVELQNLWVGSISDLCKYSDNGFSLKEVDLDAYEFCSYNIRVYSESSFVSVGFPGKPVESKKVAVKYLDPETGDEFDCVEKQSIHEFGIAYANDEVGRICARLIKMSTPKSSKIGVGDIFSRVVLRRLNSIHDIGNIGEFDELKFRIIERKDYEVLGLAYEDMWYPDAPFFKYPRTTKQTYRFRGLKMSFSHIRLAEELQREGYLFACEAHVFPPERPDESFMQPDLVVFKDSRVLIIEIDGISHWGDDASTLRSRREQYQKDREKDASWIRRGFATIRFTADKARLEPARCVEDVAAFFSS